MKTMDALLEQPLARAAILGERGAGLSRRPGQILSAVILLCVVLNIGQTWLDFRENEQVTAARLDAGVRLLDSTISERFAVMRNVLGQMDAIVDAVDDGGALSADGLRQLKSVGVGLSALMPGSELAIIAPDGAILGETGSPVYNAVPDLRAMLARPQRPSGSMLLPGRHGQVLAVLKPHWNRHGAVTATLFLMAPHTIMRDWASRLAMMPHTEALTLDAGGMLLSEYPGKGVVAPGQRLPLNGQPVAGYESVAYIESPRDGLSRMVALRRIAPPWSGGADYWVVQYGHATGDYRQGWLRSTVLNLIISVALLVLLAYYLAAERRNRIAAARAAQALRLVRKVLDTMPAPMALVDRADGSIGIGNARLLERFGAVASQGDPIVRLFMHAADWATLTAAGMADAVPMLGRHGMFLALAHCQALTVEAHGVQRYWLLSLVDVTGQQNRLAQLQDEAMRDPLTGLFNRRGFGEQAAPMAADAIRHNRPLALLALDLDHFKRVNDTYGHLAGDRVLAAVADALRHTLRDSDLPARLGGEEFAVLLPDVPAEAAWQAAERIRKAIGAMAVVLDDGQALTQTVSIGIAMFDPGDTDLQATQGRADAALYRAKAAGRNCCALDAD